MAKIGLIYFSGTGNTAWVVRQLVEQLQGLGHQVEVISCEHTSPQAPSWNEIKMLGLAFPVYGSMAPRNVREFIAQLPPGEGKPLWVVATPAIAGGDTAWYTAQPLIRKGYAPFLYANVHMPNNIYPVPGPKHIQRQLDRAKKKIARLAPLIHHQQRHLEGVHLLGFLEGWLQRPSMRHLEQSLPRYFFVNDQCIRCKRCIRHCPTHNIYRDEQDTIRFGNDCLLCLRCFHRCPQQAIQITRLTQYKNIFKRYPGPINGAQRSSQTI